MTQAHQAVTCLRIDGKQELGICHIDILELERDWSFLSLFRGVEVDNQEANAVKLDCNQW